MGLLGSQVRFYGTSWNLPLSSTKQVITARIRRMGESTVFSLSVHTREGGYPVPGLGGVPGLRSGGIPSLRSGGYPISGLRWGGYPVPGLGGYPVSVPGGKVPGLRSGGDLVSGLGGTRSQVSGVPHLRSGLGCGGYPVSGLGGVPHLRSRGVPHLRSGVLPPTDQHSELLLRGGRYASCVHAGGLSCSCI